MIAFENNLSTYQKLVFLNNYFKIVHFDVKENFLSGYIHQKIGH